MKQKQQKKKKVDPDKRLEKLDNLHRDIEAMIMMTDDDEELLLMAPLFLTTARNILVTLMGVKKTRVVISKFLDDIK